MDYKYGPRSPSERSKYLNQFCFISGSKEHRRTGQRVGQELPRLDQQELSERHLHRVEEKLSQENAVSFHAHISSW